MSEEEGKIDKTEFDKLQGKYDKTYGELVDLKKKIDSWTSLGLTPDEIRGKLEDYDGLRKKSAEGDPTKIDDLLKQKELDVRKALQKDLDDKQALIDKLTGENKEMRVVDKLFAMASPKLVNKPGAHQFFKEHVRKVCDVGEDGEIIVKDETGQVRFSNKNKAQKMGAEEFVELFINEHDYMALPTVGPNGGTLPNGQQIKSGGRAFKYSDLAAMPSGEQKKLLSSLKIEEIQALERGETIKIN